MLFSISLPLAKGEVFIGICCKQNLMSDQKGRLWMRSYETAGGTGARKEGCGCVADARACSSRHIYKKIREKRVNARPEQEGSNDVFGIEGESCELAVDRVGHADFIHCWRENKVDDIMEAKISCTIRQTPLVHAVDFSDIEGDAANLDCITKKEYHDHGESGNFRIAEAEEGQSAVATTLLVSNVARSQCSDAQTKDSQIVQWDVGLASVCEEDAWQLSHTPCGSCIGPKSASIHAGAGKIDFSSKSQVNSNEDPCRASSQFSNEEIVEGKFPEVQVQVKEGIVGSITNSSSETALGPLGITSTSSTCSQTVIQGSEVSSEAMVEQVVAIVDQAAGQILQAGQNVVDQLSEVLPASVAEVVEQVALPAAEQILATAVQTTKQLSDPFINMSTLEDDESDDSDDEFEAYKTSDLPEFRGIRGVENFTILQEDEGVLSKLYDFYTYMLKRPLPEFALGMFAAPILVSVVFTLLYLPELNGLVLDETARAFFEYSGIPTNSESPVLDLRLETVFQVFMFSVSLSTGLQPDLAPLSPYTLVVANVNALVAQLIFVFLSGAVFARLSQPSQPVRCSTVAVISPPILRHKEASQRSLMVRFVLAGPQPCELVDVKVDLSFKFNTMTRSGSYFRATHSLKLIRPEIAYLNHGMLVRHVIDETSPLYCRTYERLQKEDAIFILSVIGLERSSMQSVFHVQQYSVHDNHVIWDAEFEDMILISKRNKRIVDHSRLSLWKPLNPGHDRAT